MHIYLRGDTLQRLRLVSGLVLFVFAATHFINHALGLVGLEAMHVFQDWRKAVTRSWPGSIVLMAAALAHVGLALWKLARRATWRMPLWEAAQILIALAIPFLLIPHIMFTRVAAERFGVVDSYSYELVWLWPAYAVLQNVLLALVWAHACIGLHYWLRLAPAYRSIERWLIVPAVALPVLAIAGFIAAGQSTAEIMAEEEVFEALKERSRWPDDDAIGWLVSVGNLARIGFAGLVLVTIAILMLRTGRRPVRAKVAAGDAGLPRHASGVGYHDGPTVALVPGRTLLETSRANGVPHASVCGGRARCGTCQVRVRAGQENLPKPGFAERAVLKSIEAPEDIRLACQLRPTAPCTVEVLFRPETLSPIPVEFVEVKEIAAAHQRAVLAGETIDIPAGNRAAFQDWMAGKLTYRVALEDMAADGFALKGARLDFLNNRPTIAISYEHNNRPVSLFVLPSDAATSVAVSGQRNGQHVLGWSDDRYAYFAVAELERDELEKLEDALTERALASGDPSAAADSKEATP